MKLIQKLFFNRYYKFLFYILPLLIVSYFMIEIYSYNEKSANIIKQRIPIIKKEKSIKLFDFANDLQKAINKNNLEMKNIKIASNSVIVNIQGEFVKSINMIDFIEKYSSYLDIKRAKFDVLSANNIDLSLEVELRKSANNYKNASAKIFTKSILYQKDYEITQKNSNKNQKMKIAAIIGDSVLIGTTWYKVGSYINEQKITLIKSDHIALEQEGNIKKVWMYENEFTR